MTFIEDFSLLNSTMNNGSFKMLNEIKDLIDGKMCMAGQELRSFELDYSIISMILLIYEVFKEHSY